jgi:hypothetical protein
MRGSGRQRACWLFSWEQEQMAWMRFSSRSESPLCLVPSAGVAEDSIQQNTCLSSTLGTLGHNMSWVMSRGICLNFQSCLGLQRNYEKPPNRWCREGSWDSAGGPENCSTALFSLLPEHMTDPGFVLNYWWWQGALQKMHLWKKVFIL